MFYNTLLVCVIAEKRQMKKFYKKVDSPLNYKTFTFPRRNISNAKVQVINFVLYLFLQLPIITTCQCSLPGLIAYAHCLGVIAVLMA